MKKDEYDVIIIGAGIGGLTCGCYLAKAGMKVLIVEQHSRVGGYCTSYTRRGFTFNVLTSTLGNLGENKPLGVIVRELEIDKKVEFVRTDPSDTILTSDYSVCIYNDFNKTISKLQDCFPSDKQKIREFFDFIRIPDSLPLYFKLRDKTLKELLDSYFADLALKSLLTMMLCRLGLPPGDTYAFTSVVHFREFIMDMGYHPRGGMQVFSEAFAERFRELKGTISLGHLVDKIIIKKNKAVGVNIKGVGFLQSKFLVCACDPTNVFLNLIGKENLGKKFVGQLTDLKTGVSGFLLFLGIEGKLKNFISPTYVLSYSKKTQIYDYDPRDERYLDGEEIDAPVHLIIPSYFDETLAPEGKESIGITLFTPFKNEVFWKERKIEIADKLINRAKDILPNIAENVLAKDIVTPYILYKYTFNRNGSAHGWGAMFSQKDNSLVKQKSFIERLFFVGQWVNLPSGESGLPVAAYTGKIGARLILREKEKIE